MTNQKTGQSNHNFGLAIDFVLVSEDGSKALWDVNGKWRRVVETGK
ncbi:M15 family metallopeptidase [Priestia megaterium]